MRPPTLILSVLVHGGAIGAFAAVGVYASDEVRRPPRVEIQSVEASAPSIDQVHTEEDIAPEVLPEASPLPADLPVDPIVPERELYREVVEDSDPVVWPQLRVSMARIRPAIEPVPVETVVSPEAVELPKVLPAPASVHIAASPRADNHSPRFPKHEFALHHEGTVVLKVRVDRHGLVIAVELVEASYPGFNRAAISAVRKWRFEPGQVDGVAVEDEIPVTIEFRLSDIK